MPNSLSQIITFTLWASHPGAPVLVLGTDTSDLYGFHFQGLQASTE
jgi:hypothetical protein